MSKDKQSIQVTIRVRPLSQKQKQQDNRICVDVEEHTHSIQTFYGIENKKFTFDSIANSNTQEDMFEKVGKKSTIYCLEGYNCTIFAYGQTGSGKTFTMMGVDPAHESYDELRGLIPRTLEYLFESIDMQIKETSSEYIIRCSFLEIYNQQIIDLLNPKNNSNLQIREDIKKGVYVEGLSEETIFKGEQALEILKKGSKGRHVGSTCYNQTSSRSHSVFTMQIQSKHTKNGVVNTKIRYFHFIDLAGSERTKQINGERLKEGCSINKSLHVLGKVINSLAESTESKPRHINYRDSKLTFLLKDSLGGNSKTHLIANISPCAMSYSETNMTLAFARRVKLIKVNKASINEDMSGNLEGLKSEIKRLKQEIIMLRNGSISLGMVSLDSSQLLNEDVNASNFSQQNKTKMIQMLNRYVSQELDKQTRFEQEINKLNKKLDCLQNGIKKYAQNQIHLKMIVSVYEDKIKRTKKAETLLSAKIDELNSQSDESQKVVEYFRQERDELIKETESYKKMFNENCSVLLKLLKSCKAYQGEEFKQDGKEEFITLLKNNTQFLSLLQTELNQIKSTQQLGTENADNKSIQQVIEQKMTLMDLEYSKKETQLLERIEQLQLQIGEFKTASDQSEMLLKDSVNREISLQEEIKTKQTKLQELEEVVRKFEEKEKEKDKKIEEIEKQLNQVKDEYLKMRKQLEGKNIKIEQLTKTETQLIKLNQSLKTTHSNTIQENTSLKTKLAQIQAELIDSTNDHNQKILSLQQSLKLTQQQQSNLQQQILSLKQQLQQKDHHIEELNFQHKKQTEETSNSIHRLESLLVKHEREITQLNDVKTKQEEKLKNQQQKISSLTQNIESRQQENQKLSLNIVQLHHQLEAKSNKITHLEHLLKDKQTESETYSTKSKQKEEELLQIINQMQTSSDSSSQEFNKIRIQSIHLRQTKSQLQLKVNKFSDQIKQLYLEIQSKNTQINELKGEIEEKARKILYEKEQINKKKEEIRNLTYNLEQVKLQCARCIKTISQKDEQFEQVHSKNIQLMEESNQSKRQLNETRLQLKQLQTKIFCQEKSLQIQKQTLAKETERKVSKLNEQLTTKTSELKKFEKAISELKLRQQALECQVKGLKELNIKNEQMFRQSLEKELMNKSIEVNGLKDSISLLEESLQNLKLTSEQKICDLQNEIINLKKNQKELLNLIQTLKLQVSKISETLQEKNKQIKSLQDAIQQMKEQHEAQLEDLEIEHNEQIDSKNQQIDAKNEEITRKDEEITKKDEIIHEKNTQIERTNSLLQKKEGQFLEGDKLRRLLEQEANKLFYQLNIKAQQTNKILGDLSVLRGSIEVKEKSLIETNQHITKLKSQITRVNQALSLKEQLIKQIQSQADSQQHETSIKLSNLIDQKNQEIEKLKDENNRLSEEVISLKQKIVQLEEELSLSKDNYIKLETQNKQLSSNNTTLTNQISSLNQQLHQSHLSIEQNQHLISELNQQLHSLLKSTTEEKSSIFLLNKELSTAKTILQSKQQEITQLTVSMKEVHLEIEEVKVRKVEIEQKYQEVCGHNQKLQVSIEELNAKLDQINSINQEIHSENQHLHSDKSHLTEQLHSLTTQLHSLKDQHALQLHQLKTTHFQHSTELQQLIKSQKHKIQELQLLVKQKQANLSTLSQVSKQKQELMQSYKSLQQINKGLGRKCEELLTSLQEQKTQYRKLETKYLGQKNINENLKQLIENSQQQKKHLSNQLKDKTEIYQKLVQKISKNESLHSDKEKKSQHYLKTVDLLEKSRYEQLQLRKNNQELKRQIIQKTQLIEKKELQVREISKKYQTLQSKVKDFEQDYLELQSKYQQLLQNQKLYDNFQQQNTILKQQLEQTRPKISRMTLKIQELQEKIRSINQEYIELQNQNHELKKKILYPGTTDQRTSMYINKLKSQINDLKKEKLILQDTIKKQTSEKMKLKTDLIKNQPKSPENYHQTQQLRQQLQKRLTQMRYLQEIIAEMIDILKIKQFQQGTNPKSIKIQSIRKGIMTSIKEKIQQNKYLKERIHEIQSRLNFKEKQNKFISSIVYNGIGSQSSAKKQSSNQSYQSSQKVERREKSFSMKEEELSHLIRNKIASSTISGQQYSQEKRERKVLQMGQKTFVDNDEALNSTKEKMKVKEILSNNRGKFYSDKIVI